MADFVHGREHNVEPQDWDQAQGKLPSQAPYLPGCVAFSALEHFSQLGSDILFSQVMLVLFATNLVNIADDLVAVISLGGLYGRHRGLDLFCRGV